MLSSLKKYVVFAFSLMSLLLLSSCGKDSAEWNYAIELVIETPDGVKEGRVVRTGSLQYLVGFAQRRGISGSVEGEALAIEILPGQWLFGLVNENGMPRSYYEDVQSGTPQNKGEVAAFMRWYENRPEGYGRDIVVNPQTVYEHIPEDATREKERAIKSRNAQRQDAAPRSTYPGTLVTFTDINDPSTIQLVDLADLEATFGEGVRFVSGRYEYTGLPMTQSSIENVLPWVFEPLTTTTLMGDPTGFGFFASLPPEEKWKWDVTRNHFSTDAIERAQR